MILYRPVGTGELKLIEKSGFRRFPPRLPEQPFFYPVLNEQYAVEIASQWNVKYNADHKGYVMELSECEDQWCHCGRSFVLKPIISRKVNNRHQRRGDRRGPLRDGQFHAGEPRAAPLLRHDAGLRLHPRRHGGLLPGAGPLPGGRDPL